MPNNMSNQMYDKNAMLDLLAVVGEYCTCA